MKFAVLASLITCVAAFTSVPAKTAVRFTLVFLFCLPFMALLKGKILTRIFFACVFNSSPARRH